MTLSIGNWFNFNVLSVAPVECFHRVTYFDTLIFTTLAPALVALIILLVSLLRVWRTTGVEAKDNARSTVSYLRLLYSFCILPGCTSTSFRYFGCSHYDMGEYSENIAMLDIEPNIMCDVKSYKKWRPFVALMIIIYPVGVPLTYYALLWRMCDMLDPPTDVVEKHEGTHDAEVIFAEKHDHHTIVMQ